MKTETKNLMTIKVKHRLKIQNFEITAETI